MDPRLATLCVRLGDDSDPVRADLSVRPFVDEVVARLHAGDLDRLSDDLDEIEDRLLRAAYAAGLSSTRVYRPLPGAGRSSLEFLACPAGRCPRVELPGSEATCAIVAAPMTRTRLGS